MEELSHDEISARFLESKAIDFEALGRFVADLGPELVLRDRGLHGVFIGKLSTIACSLSADDLQRVLGGGGLRRFAQATDAMDLPAQS